MENVSYFVITAYFYSVWIPYFDPSEAVRRNGRSVSRSRSRPRDRWLLPSLQRGIARAFPFAKRHRFLDGFAVMFSQIVFRNVINFLPEISETE